MVEALKEQMKKDLDRMVPIDDLSVVATPVIWSSTDLHGDLITATASLGMQDVNIPFPHQGT